jgi:probable F420-dependent oxidoreductase
MKFGVHVRPTADTLDVRTIGRMVEAHGFESVFFPEHTHIPTVMQSKYPGDPEWLRRCMRMLDPFVALAVVAAVTEQLLLGTGVCLVPQHHPITLAKQVATLDLLSGGRALFGVGAGWGREEMANHGTDPALRWRLMRERLLAIKRIWTEDEPEFQGELVRFGPIWQWPKPIQKPHPPILVGGEGPHVLERVVDYGDEWMPNDHPELEERVGELQRLAAARGRGPIPITVFDAPTDPALIQRYAAAGVTRCVFTIPSNDAEQFGATLARLRELIYRSHTSPVQG